MIRKLSLYILLAVIITVNSYSQISLVPSMYFIKPASRSGSISVINTSSDPREVDVYVTSGIIDYDENGNAFVNPDSLTNLNFSLTPYIKVFPERLIIPPKNEQKIRFRVYPTPDMPDGILTARVHARSQPVVQQIDTIQEGVITPKIVVRTEIVGVIAYKKGNDLTTGLNIPSIKTETDSANLKLMVEYQKSGNAPFLGWISIEIQDSEGETIDKAINQYCVAYLETGRQTFRFNKYNYPTGAYKAIISVSNKRTDIPEEYWLSFDPFTKEFDFSIP